MSLWKEEWSLRQVLMHLPSGRGLAVKASLTEHHRHRAEHHREHQCDVSKGTFEHTVGLLSFQDRYGCIVQ